MSMHLLALPLSPLDLDLRRCRCRLQVAGGSAGLGSARVPLIGLRPFGQARSRGAAAPIPAAASRLHVPFFCSFQGFLLN